jgi:hypothetical protein
MKQEQIKEFEAWLKQNYANPEISKESIAHAFGMSVGNVERYATKLQLRKGRPAQYRTTVTEKQIKVPEGASKTKHGYLMQVGAKTLHRMA